MKPLIVVAHPDDETIGAASWLIREPSCVVVHVTDGAPRDPAFWLSAHNGSRAQYAQVRRTEFEAVAELVGLPRAQQRCLGLIDLEVVHSLRQLAEQVLELVLAHRPTHLVTHAYEGGHPDHDAVAAACRAAGSLLLRRGYDAPELREFALYHGLGGHLNCGTFLPSSGPPPELVVLSKAEAALRRQMLEAYASQGDLLRPFMAVEVEQWRSAASCDFSRAPHDGLLYYEQCGLPVSAGAWRAVATSALQALGVSHFASNQ